MRVAPWGTWLRLSWTCPQRQNPRPSLTLRRQVHGVSLHRVWSTPLTGVAVTVVVHVAMVTPWEGESSGQCRAGGEADAPLGASLSQPAATLSQGEARPPTSEKVAPLPCTLSGPELLVGEGGFAAGHPALLGWVPMRRW